MSMNPIQFQEGLSFKTFQSRYGTNQQCEDALFASRWPNGWSCSRCSNTRYSRTHNGRRLWECLKCGYQSSSIVGTVFEHTKLPLTTWFLAMYLLTQNKNGISALALKRQLGVRYKTAWLIKHKLLKTMQLQEASRRLEGRVEIDDAYLGGEKAGKRGRGSDNKTPFVAAVQTDAKGRPRFIRLSPVVGFTRDALAQWAKDSLAPTAHVVSDGLGCFKALAAWVTQHERHVVGHGRQAVKRPEFHWVNTILGNLKTALSGTYHAFKHTKYADRYLAEFAYRFNHRFDLPAMLPQLLLAVVNTKPQPLCKIRLSEARG
jgi:transposase-like protein